MICFKPLLIYQPSTHLWTTADTLQLSADQANFNLHQQKIYAAI